MALIGWFEVGISDSGSLKTGLDSEIKTDVPSYLHRSSYFIYLFIYYFILFIYFFKYGEILSVNGYVSYSEIMRRIESLVRVVNTPP